MDSWDVLAEAEKSGWCDHGLTEPLEKTLERARAFMASPPTIPEGRCCASELETPK